MVPGPRKGCMTPSCRHTRPKRMDDRPATQWRCDPCKRGRRFRSKRWAMVRLKTAFTEPGILSRERN